jgi:hypothetical protein
VNDYDRAGQITDDNTAHVVACWIPKAIHTHTQNTFYLLLSHNNNGCTNAPQCYVVRTLRALLKISLHLHRILLVLLPAVICYAYDKKLYLDEQP